MDLKLKQHFRNTQNKSVYDKLIIHAKLKGWYNTYMVMPVSVLYEEADPLNLSVLIKQQASLQNAFSLNSRDFLQTVQPIRLLDPMVLLFGTTVR